MSVENKTVVNRRTVFEWLDTEKRKNCLLGGRGV